MSGVRSLQNNFIETLPGQFTYFIMREILAGFIEKSGFPVQIEPKRG